MDIIAYITVTSKLHTVFKISNYKKILPGDKLMMVEDLDWHQRATAQPRAFLDKYKQWEASGNRKIASHGLLVLTHIFYELVALKL